MGYTSNTGGELPSTWIRLSKSVNATLYVAKENQTAYSVQFNDVTASIQNYMLFTDADLNKQIKVWISTTPPPLVRKSSGRFLKISNNSSLKRRAV